PIANLLFLAYMRLTCYARNCMNISMKKLVFLMAFFATMSRLEAAHSDTALEVFTPVDGPVAAGLGSRFVAYSHNGKFAAVVNQLAHTLSVYRVDSDSGAFILIQTVDPGSDTAPFEFAYAPCDTFAAVADLNGSILVYSIDCVTGEWSLLQKAL